jgi:tetratricopeptide (TPR) repeat protein
MAAGRWNEAIAQLEKISEVSDYLISDYATLAFIYLRKGDIGKCYYYLSRAYELEEDKEIADILRGKSASVGEER